jgi:nucleolar protein 58
MLVLFETPAGYALFKVLDEGLLKKPDNIWESFENPSKASKAYVISHSPEIPHSSENPRVVLMYCSNILVERLHVVCDSCLTPAHFGYFRVKLHAFEKFEDTAQALAAATAVVEGKLDKDLKSFLKKWVSKKGLKDGTYDQSLFPRICQLQP